MKLCPIIDLERLFRPDQPDFAEIEDDGDTDDNSSDGDATAQIIALAIGIGIAIGAIAAPLSLLHMSSEEAQMHMLNIMI